MKEFADFLGGQPPFDALDADDLARLVAHVEVEYFAPGALVVAEDEDHLDHLWVVRTGALEVFHHGRVIDLLGPGDTFGHVSLLSRLPPGFGVRAHEESLCLRIADPRQFLARPDRLRFAAIGTVAGERLTHAGVLSHAARPLTSVMRPVVWCLATDTIRDAAARIGAADSCALVRTATGTGIVTDHDFRRRVATGELGIDAPVTRLATVPVLTIEDGATQAAGLLAMVEHGVHHLVVTDQAGEPVGVVRVADLAQIEVRDPLLIRSAIETSPTIEALVDACRLLPATLVELSEAGVPATRVGGVYAALVDAIVRRILTLRASPTLAELRPSWVLLGSLARREPLPRSDIDTALVWPDLPQSAPDPGDAIRAEAEHILDDLDRCGLARCANGTNATNPLFSRSESAWGEAARTWMHDPTIDGALLLSAMVADSRPLTELPLGRKLTDMIRSHTRTTQFLRALLDEALRWRPPTGFVRDFVVQHTGEHRGQLDLKRGGLAPVVALGRWIGIVSGDAGGTTPQRLGRGPATGLLTDDEAHTLIGAFEGIYTLVLRHEVGAIRDGAIPTTFIVPRDLDTLTRRHLRDSFRAIASVQARVDEAWMMRLSR